MKLGKSGVLIIVGFFIVTVCSINTIGYNVDKIECFNFIENNYDENITFSDFEDDVFGMGLDEIFRTEEKPNINIINVNCIQRDKNITIILEVKGEIEDRGNLESELGDTVQYVIEIYTSNQFYEIWYINKSCELGSNKYEEKFNISNFTVDGAKLIIPFNLNNSNEVIENIELASLDIDITGFNLSLSMDFASMKNRDVDIEIEKPKNSLYIFNKKIINLDSTVIFGKIDIEIKSDSEIPFLSELYIDEELISSEFPGYLSWNSLSFGKHVMKVLCFDVYGNRDYEEIEVWKFF